MYRFFAEKEKSIAPQTLNAAVSGGSASTNDRSYTKIIPQPSPAVNPQSEKKLSIRTEAPLTDREIVGEAMESAAKNDAEPAFMRRYQDLYAKINEDAQKIREQQSIMDGADPKSDEDKRKKAKIILEKAGIKSPALQEILDSMRIVPQPSPSVNPESEKKSVYGIVTAYIEKEASAVSGSAKQPPTYAQKRRQSASGLIVPQSSQSVNPQSEEKHSVRVEVQ